MINKYAVISDIDFIVQTVVVWDGISRWKPRAGTFLVQLEEHEPCSSEWTYEEGATPRFIEPPVVEETGT
jgi:hypothetical protein